MANTSQQTKIDNPRPSFFKRFQDFSLVGKQVYKPEQLVKWRIHDIFPILLQE